MGHLAHDQSAMVQILLVTDEAAGKFHMLTFCVLLATQSLVIAAGLLAAPHSTVRKRPCEGKCPYRWEVLYFDEG